MTRLTYGGQALRAVALLPGVTGAYGRYGGGALLATAASFELNYNAVRKPSGPAATRTVNHIRLGEALLELNDPPIRALFVAANNPAVTCPDTGKTRRGLAREDLFTVVHDPFMSVTARYADIVLPATTYLETEDFFRAYGTYYMQYCAAGGGAAGRGVVQPAPGAGTGRAHGCDRPGVPHVGAGDPARAVPWRDRASRRCDPDRAARRRPDVHRDPKAARNSARRPASWSSIRQTLAAQGLPPMPDWQPDPEEAQQAAQWPLRLLTAPGYFQSHTAFSGVGFLRQREGAPFCVLHPDDAGARDLPTASGCGWSTIAARSGSMLHVRDEVQPGVVLVPGQRPDDEAVAGTVNMLCSDAYHRHGRGRHLPEHLAGRARLVDCTIGYRHTAGCRRSGRCRNGSTWSSTTCSEHIATITLNRPDKLNAVNDDMVRQIAAALQRFDTDNDARVAILCGRGRAFSSGADVQQRQLRSREEFERHGGAQAQDASSHDLLLRAVNWKPVIAAPHGYVLGLALGLMLECDLIVAEEGTKFQVTETPRGLSGAKYWALLNFRGAGAFATDVSLTGRFFTAEEALAAGVIERVAPRGTYMEVARALAAAVAKNPPLGVRSTMRARR